MQDVNDLRSNLQQYKTQLQQVNGLLQLDVNNAEYQKLAADLRSAIKLTEELLKTQTKGAGGSELQLRKGDDVPTVPLKAGDVCLAPYGDQMYPGLVVSVDSDGDHLTIRYFGYPDVESRPRTDLKPLPPPTLDPTQITVGFECQALWIGDGQWYDAVVDEGIEGGYKVRFTQYKNEAEVPLEYMRSKDSAAPTTTNAGAGKKRPADAQAKEPKKFEIPENLRIMPTDTDEEKARKRKKLKYLKNAVKKKEQDDEAETSKSWQDFVNKSKKPKGLKVLRKESIFASPTEVSGKVGVTGSGQGMTDFAERHKLKVHKGQI